MNIRNRHREGDREAANVIMTWGSVNEICMLGL